MNSRTQATFAGPYFFAVAGAFSLINAMLRLLACVWIFTFEWHDMPGAGMGLALTILCFVAALLCRRGFD